MKRAAIEQFAREQIDNLEFGDSIFFGWTNSKGYAGLASRVYDRSTKSHIYLLSLSAFYYRAFKDKKDIKDTVLHELAHIVANYYNDVPMSSHGDEWKFYAKTLGARPERCFSADADSVDLSLFKYVAYCPNDCIQYGYHRLGRVLRLNYIGSNHGYICKKCNSLLEVRKNY